MGIFENEKEEREKEARLVWQKLGDVPVDDECIDIPFMHFPKGTEVTDIWHWVESEYDVCIGKDLMYKGE